MRDFDDTQKLLEVKKHPIVREMALSMGGIGTL